jgi:hypothetical protein
MPKADWTKRIEEQMVRGIHCLRERTPFFVDKGEISEIILPSLLIFQNTQQAGFFKNNVKYYLDKCGFCLYSHKLKVLLCIYF